MYEMFVLINQNIEKNRRKFAIYFVSFHIKKRRIQLM